MHFEEYGDRNNSTIVFLHGAFFVHSFGRQYELADEYHLLVPHIRGYGKEVLSTFESEKALSELSSFIKALNKKVTLIGFSLGAQLAVQLFSNEADLFNGAVFVSPWLIKDQEETAKALEENKKQLKTMQNKTLCALIGLMNGLPKAQRREFVEEMQNVSEESLKNSLYNGITLESISDFANVDLPSLALAGGKEEKAVKESVLSLEKMNARCKAEIWPKAAHNIPPLFHKQFNQLIRNFMQEIN